MALNIATFKTRALTALIFVAVMLTGLLWNFWSFLILFTVIHFGCWYELVKLMKKIYSEKYLLFSLLGLVYITMPIFMLIKMSFVWTGFDFMSKDGWGANKKVYLWLFPCLIIFSIWINDTMAYLVGSVIGKTPFSKISPKKTWEGTIGGIILCILAIGIFFFMRYRYTRFTGYNMPFPAYHWFIVPALCAIFGTLGDLFESKLKRLANVKDSGAIMPGHGGFLDRFDSLLFATPAVWLYVYFFIK
jgi:phosphatidate cytidylyltransferase